MKPFNLQDALAGAPVVTRNGEKVVRVVHLPEARNTCHVVFVTECGEMFTTHADGLTYVSTPTSNDLFMAPTRKQAWVNVYKNSKKGIFPGLLAFSTKSEGFARAYADADAAAKYDSSIQYVDTKLLHEWEE